MVLKKLKDKIYVKVNSYSSKVGLDLPYFVSGGFYLSLMQGFIMLKGFLLAYIFANYFTKEFYGQYTFVMTLLGILMIFSLIGINATIISDAAKKFDGNYYRSLKKSFLFSILGSFSLLFFVFYGKYVGRDYGSFLFLILAFIFPFYAISSKYMFFFLGKKRFDLNAILSVIFNTIHIIVLLLVIFFTKDLFYIILTYVLGHTLIEGYYTLFIVRKYLENKKVDKKSIEFAQNISLSSAFSTIALKIDFLIISYFLGFEQVAIFAIIILLPDQFKTIFNMFTPMILPKIANQKTKHVDVIKHFKKLLLISLISIIGYAAIAPFIFKYFFPQYLEYMWHSILFNITFISISYLIFQNYLIKDQKSLEYNKITINSSIILLLCSPFLIYFYGIIGALVARAIYRFFLLAYSFVLFKKINYNIQ